ncbi:hypothetical protein J2Z69_002683 [Paenibacillus shirakamiensis]|uniref:Hydrolase n=1 Tax=Paenibacillus shirakamiensis TaxID=1265935 RepID=A0ABS4JIW1_9BACL|nr:hypothetical protein [Paenibacillus shirakamiensis]MBP2001638.1 hypothetical protein [Paenibacillus shirakamiensis]
MSQKQRYYVSVTNQIIQDVRNESTEFAVDLDGEELGLLTDKLNDLLKEDEYTLQRAAVPYKSADKDEATDHYNDRMIQLYEMLVRVGTEETREAIYGLGVLNKLDAPDYNDKGYGEGSPTNR